MASVKSTLDRKTLPTGKPITRTVPLYLVEHLNEWTSTTTAADTLQRTRRIPTPTIGLNGMM